MSNAGEGGAKPAGENKPLGAPRGKRPRIRVSCVDQLGACRCHHGHKPGDVFDFDRDRGKMCAMACHVGFPISISCAMAEPCLATSPARQSSAAPKSIH